MPLSILPRDLWGAVGFSGSPGGIAIGIGITALRVSGGQGVKSELGKNSKHRLRPAVNALLILAGSKRQKGFFSKLKNLTVSPCSQELVKKIRKLLKAEDDLSFLLKLSMDELKTLVAKIRERVDQVGQ